MRKELAKLNEEKSNLIDRLHAVDETIEALNLYLEKLYKAQEE